MYAAFTAYLSVSLLWSPDAFLGLNTLIPAVNFLLILILYGSLATYHDLRSVLAGFLGGFLFGAIAFTYVEGFPFVYPKYFSYNAGAAMYLFGLLVTLLFGWYSGSRKVALAIGFVILLHIAATTSIKTNLGVLLGVFAASIVFIGRFSRILLRNTPLILAIVGLLVFAVVSNEAILNRVEVGVGRVARGVAIIQAGQDMSGSTSFDLRTDWAARGIEGWKTNPIFGDGVEAFRADHGTTSHSTPIDLLYNTGLIGFCLFYAIFVSIAWRLFKIRHSEVSGLRPLIFAGLTCYLFITLSGTVFYQTFFAVFVALSVALLRPHRNAASRPVPAVVYAR